MRIQGGKGKSLAERGSMLTRICVLGLLALALFGQDYRAKIQGIVTDASDASMAGAKVTIRNVNTGITATRETGANGAYLFDNVKPGTYVASAESQGLSRQQQEGVLVLTRADVTEKLGQQQASPVR